MNRTTIRLALMIGSLCLPAALCHAWATPPSVVINDWVHYVWADSIVSFSAEDTSGTYIEEWSWYCPGGTEQLWENSCGGYDGTSTAGFAISDPGVYSFWAYACNEYGLWDSDYGMAYAISVSITDCPAVIGYGGSAHIAFTMEPMSGSYRHYARLYIKNSSGTTVRSVDLGEAIGAQSYDWDGKNDSGNYVSAGTYPVSVELHGGPPGSNVFADTATINVLAVAITAPATFPASVGVGATLELGATPLGVFDGSYTWTPVSGPGGVTIEPSNGAAPRFSATQPGNYVVGVTYRKGGVSSPRRDTGIITAVTPTVSITTPSSSLVYVAPGELLQLDCATSVGGGSYVWSQAGPDTGTFNDPNIKNPNFCANTPGLYNLTIRYNGFGGYSPTAVLAANVVTLQLDSPLWNTQHYIDLEIGDSVAISCSASTAWNTFNWECDKSTGWYIHGSGEHEDKKGANTYFVPTAAGSYRVRAKAVFGSATKYTNFSASAEIRVKKPNATITPLPGSPPGYIEYGELIELSCTTDTPEGREDGAFLWTQDSGPGTLWFVDDEAETSTLKNPRCTASEWGTYRIKLVYTKGAFHEDNYATIRITEFHASIDEPTIPSTVDWSDPIKLVGSTDAKDPDHCGQYHWTATPSEGVVWSPGPDVADPRFSSTQPGEYSIVFSYEKNNQYYRVHATDNIAVTVSPVDVRITSPTQATVWTPLNTPVSLTCEPRGATGGALTWTACLSGGEPSSEGFSYPNWPDITSAVFAPTQPGAYTVEAKYEVTGGFAVAQRNINIYQLAITSPTGTARDICFETDAYNRCNCSVTVQGTAGSTEWATLLEWTLTDPAGHEWVRAPSNGKGASVMFTYWDPDDWIYDLPASNSDFGGKTVTLTLKDSEGAVLSQITGHIRVFFDPTGFNHPGGGTPNWYYYWKQGVVGNLHLFAYDPYNTQDCGHYNEGNNTLYICASAFGDFSRSWSLDNPFRALVNAGANGKAESEAIGLDIQTMAVGEQGEPYETVIEPGWNDFLDPMIRTGSGTLNPDYFKGDDGLSGVIEATYYLDCDRLGDVAATVSHEMTHQRNERTPGDDVDGDNVTDCYENQGPYWLYARSSDTQDTFGFRIRFPEYGGNGSGDDEFLAWMAEMSGSSVDGDADWTQGGRQWQVDFRE
jgi:hypothetical protein